MKIGVYGAGAIGCLLGGSIVANTKHEVVFVGRPTLIEEIKKKQGFELTNHTGEHVFVKEESIRCLVEIHDLLSCNVILLTMKLTTLKESVTELLKLVEKEGITREILLIPLQNGVRSLTIVDQVLKGKTHPFRVLGGIVTFGVLWRDLATFHQSTDGPIYLEKPKNGDKIFEQFVEALSTAFPVITSPDIRGIMYGKLLVNLVNAVNALSGVMLTNRAYRTIWGASIGEGLNIMKKAGIRPANVLKLPINIFPYLLSSRLIYWIFQRAQKVDKKGYSSMSQDLQKKRETEIDYINGEIVEISSGIGESAPINAKIIELIKTMEQNNRDGIDMHQGIPRTGNELAIELGVNLGSAIINIDTVLMATTIAIVGYAISYFL